MKVVTIGRSSECDVVINDPFVGRTHLQLVFDNGKYYCVDLNSKNGTFVNGRQIAGKVQLNETDIIRIGNTTLPWKQYKQQYKDPILTGKNRKTFLIPIMVVLVVLLVFGGIYIYLEDNHSSDSVNPTEQEEVQTSQLYSSNAKPTIDHIQYDLIGHKLSEGVSDGYHKQDWTYEIKNNSISSFYVKKTLEDNGNNYVVVASCRLKGGDNSNFYYDTELKIGYINKGNGWKLNYVNSLGMNVVSDGQYNDCILYSLVDDGWGGVNCLNIRNTSECSLVVAGQIKTYNNWTKFSTMVSPHKSTQVGGTFGGGSVKDYVIDFVVREQ